MPCAFINHRLENKTYDNITSKNNLILDYSEPSYQL